MSGVLRGSGPRADQASVTLAAPPPRVIIYAAELERIGRHVADRRTIETGGELFGLVTPSGSLVIHLASGPGPSARHERLSFHQDRAFMLRLFAQANERHVLQHLGSWHSHHGLALAEPSGGDDGTMALALEASGFSSFLLVIANLVDDAGRPHHAGRPEARAFLYRTEAPRRPLPCEWRILPGASPFRAFDKGLASTDTAPSTASMPTRAVPLAQDVDHARVDPTASAAAAPGLAHALRDAAWVLTEAGTAIVDAIVTAFGGSIRPTPEGELAVSLGTEATLTLGPEQDGRVRASLLITHGEAVTSHDLSGPAEALLHELQRVLPIQTDSSAPECQTPTLPRVVLTDADAAAEIAVADTSPAADSKDLP